MTDTKCASQARMGGGFLGSVLTDALGITMTNFDALWQLVMITTLTIPIPLLLIKRIPQSV